MREAVVHKVGNRSGLAGQRRSGANAQKPQRRENSGEGIGSRLRSLLNYFPSVLKIVVAAVIGVVLFASYRAAASATFFNVRSVEVQGNTRVAKDDVRNIVRQQTEKTGVWNADLTAVAARLERLAWVRTAVVSRVLPDGLRVRISERVPRAVVRTAAGRFRWVDEEAVLLGEMLPTDQIPAFFLRGLSEEDSDTARYENRERVQKFLELKEIWDTAGLSERVSELNLMDIRDVRAQLAGNSSHIEVRLGSQDQGIRLKDALTVLDSQRQTPRGSLISYLDMSTGKRAIVGLSSGASTTSDETNESVDSVEPTTEKRPVQTTPAGVTTSNQARTAETRKQDVRDKPSTSEKKSDKPKETARRRT
ncbi:MAG TPA: FtsQ-type POTRA domain-containing protein [Pyrinomonadaceae bacterium]|nr:FtsQ-type POTRA domain-containing protein [Pyrinomonadaceae bacterium]